MLHFDVIVSWVRKHPVPVWHPPVLSPGLVRVWGLWDPREVGSREYRPPDPTLPTTAGVMSEPLHGRGSGSSLKVEEWGPPGAFERA